MYKAKRTKKESNELVLEVSKYVNDRLRETNCARSIHMINTKTVLNDVQKNNRTYCTICGVLLEWRKSEDGIWEFWEVTD